MFISMGPFFPWHPYQVSVTQCINHVYKSSPLTLHFLNPSWGPTSHVLSETECLAPSQIDRRTIALQRGLRGTWERTEPRDSLSSFALSTWLWLSARAYSPEMDEIGSISNDFERTMLSSPTWGNCRLYRGREVTFWNVIVKHDCKMKSNLNVLLDKNH